MASKEKVREFFRAAKIGGICRASIDVSVFDAIAKSVKGSEEDKERTMAEFMEQSMEAVGKMSVEFIESIYEEEFSDEEMDELTEIHKSPAMEHLIRFSPAIPYKIAEFLTGQAKAINDKLKEIVREVARKNGCEFVEGIAEIDNRTIQ